MVKLFMIDNIYFIRITRYGDPTTECREAIGAKHYPILATYSHTYRHQSSALSVFTSSVHL